MTTRRPTLALPIRSLKIPARLGRRQRLVATVGCSAAACVRFVKSNLAAAHAARPVWLGGPLFLHRPLRSVVAEAR